MKMITRSSILILSGLLVVFTTGAVLTTWFLRVFPQDQGEPQESAVIFTATVILSASLTLGWATLFFLRYFMGRDVSEEACSKERSLGEECVPGIGRVEGLFGLVERLVPARLSNEELGDAYEKIKADLQAGGSPFRAWVVAFFAVGWVLVNAVREVMSAVLGRPRPS